MGFFSSRLPTNVSNFNLDFLVDRFVTRDKQAAGSTPPFSCKSSPSGLHYGVADEVGFVTIYSAYESNWLSPSYACYNLPTRWEAHENAVFDLSWSFDSEKIVTASGDQTCVLWDAKSLKAIRLFTGHFGSVKTVDFNPYDQNIFVSGARDGSIMVWDVRAAKADGCVLKIANAHLSEDHIRITPGRKKTVIKPHSTSVTCVLFQTDNCVVSSGSDDNSIKIWDARRSYVTSRPLPIPSHTVAYSSEGSKKGYSHLTFDKSRLVLYANCINNTIYKYDMCRYDKSPVAEYTGHLNDSFFVKSSLSPNEQYLMSGSSDNNAYIWKVSKPGAPMWSAKYHSAEVTAVSWNYHDITQFVTCGDDCHVTFWSPRFDCDEKSEFRGFVERLPVPETTQNQSSCYTPSQKKLVSKITPTTKHSDYSVLRKSPFRQAQITPKSSISSVRLNIMATPKSSTSVQCDSDCENEFSLCTSKSEMTPTTSVLSPSKKENTKHLKSGSARRNLLLENSDDVCVSPTSGLPNFVVDGNSPNVYSSSRKQSKSKIDWLSRHGRQCKRRKIEVEKSASQAQHSVALAKKNSPFSVSKSKSIESYFKKL